MVPVDAVLDKEVVGHERLGVFAHLSKPAEAAGGIGDFTCKCVDGADRDDNTRRASDHRFCRPSSREAKGWHSGCGCFEHRSREPFGPRRQYQEIGPCEMRPHVAHRADQFDSIGQTTIRDRGGDLVGHRSGTNESQRRLEIFRESQDDVESSKRIFFAGERSEEQHAEIVALAISITIHLQEIFRDTGVRNANLVGIHSEV